MVDHDATLGLLEAVKCLTDEQVISQTKQLLRLERRLTASALVHLSEMEARGLASHLTVDNEAELAERVRGCSAAEAEQHVAEERAASVLALDAETETSLDSEDELASERASEPIDIFARGPELYRVEFIAGRRLYERLREAASLLSEEDEEIALGEVVELALDTLFDSSSHDRR